METLEAIKKRVSVRGYLDKQITDADLDKVLKAGMQAPIGRGKYYDMHITVIQNKDFLEKIDNLTDRHIFYKAPTLIIVSARDDGHGLDKENSACVMENMTLAATDLGLGSIYLNLVIGLIKENKDILKELHLEEGFVPIAALGIGYTDGEVEPKDHSIEVTYIK